MKLYRVLRRLWSNPGEAVTLDTVDEAGIAALIAKGIVEALPEDEQQDEEEVNDGD